MIIVYSISVITYIGINGNNVDIIEFYLWLFFPDAFIWRYDIFIIRIFKKRSKLLLLRQLCLKKQFEFIAILLGGTT